MIGYLGLGSNVGDRRAHLQAAAGLLDGVDVLASSSVYETEPVGEVVDQRAFFNACLRIDTALDPEALLDACKAAERARGRAPAGEPGYVWHGPRPLDVDVLLLGNLEYASARLTLPHAETSSRRFVLVPLLELDPALTVPGRGPAAALLDALGDAGAVTLAGPPLVV
ncbi:MAG: 2-amino-4-hydroxy-6-hydroxymethyldihydropteridine diphosphokinase [Solirubrobacteraceae bacterium]|nr:2-amino-4-hydroxy-6-hydroxymethyldihydropteridine diphosphokinase [Solirubrobacteraceae bacterium]